MGVLATNEYCLQRLWKNMSRIVSESDRNGKSTVMGVELDVGGSYGSAAFEQISIAVFAEPSGPFEMRPMRACGAFRVAIGINAEHNPASFFP